MLVATLALVVGISALLWWVLKPSRYHQLLAKIPGPTPIPILGNALQLKSDTAEFFQQLMDYCDEYGPRSHLYKISIGNQDLVVVFQASTAEKVLGSMKVLSKAYVYEFLKPWLKTGLLTGTGAKWQSRRKLLTPSFHFKILNDFLHVFNEQAEVLVGCLEEKCDGAPFDIFPFITHCALDVICETAMGKKIGAQTGSGNSAYVEAVYGMSDLIMIRLRSPWQWPDIIYRNTERGRRHDSYLRILQGFTRQVIEERKKEMEENPDSVDANQESSDGAIGNKKRRAFLDLLLHMATEANFSIEDIQEEVDTFMFEGHDTTAAAISWAIQLIGSHPEVQKKLNDEMNEVFRDSNRPVTSEDLTKMKYLECVIKESLRVLPSVPMIGRMLDEDLEIDNVTIPKGASLLVLIWKINMDPKYFPDPQRFDPDRFLPENATSRHPYTYIPFSAGPRNCIGQKFAQNEVKCVLSAVLRNFNIESTQTVDEIRPIPDLIVRPTNGIKVKLTKRSTYLMSDS